VLVAKQATSVIPIVFAAANDPVGGGLDIDLAPDELARDLGVAVGASLSPGSLPPCCARAASGHTTAPPSSGMNERRFTAQNLPCFRPKG